MSMNGGPSAQGGKGGKSIFARMAATQRQNLQQGGSSSSSGPHAGGSSMTAQQATAGGTSSDAEPHYPGYDRNFVHYDHLMEGERKRANPRWETLSAYQKKFFVGQRLHESPPDDWKVLDPRVTRRVPHMADKWRLVASFLEARGLISCQLESFNSFVNQGISDIVLSRSNVEIRCDVDPAWFIRFTGIRVGRPQMADERRLQDTDVYPHECRLRDLTYQAPIYVSYYYYAGKNAQTPTVAPEPLLLGYMPVMLRSDRCHLRGKSDEQLMGMNECPLDPGGYFIIDGTERVLMMQENMSNNRIIVERSAGSPDKLQAAVTSSTNDNKSRVLVCYSNKNCLHLKHSKFQSLVNVICVIKAMGVVHDQEIVQMIGVGKGSRIVNALLPTFQEAKDLGVFTQEQGLEYLGRMMKERFISTRAATAAALNQAGAQTIVPKAMQARQALEIVLSHVAMDQSAALPFLGKVRYLCIMIRRIFEAEESPDRLVDDKDYYGNKRIEQASSMLSMLFEDVFKTLGADVRKRADAEIGKLVTKQDYTHADILKRTVQESLQRVTHAFKYALKSGNWKIQRFKVDRSGVSQVLSRFSYMIALGSMTKVKSNVEKSHKIAGPRALQPSQWGMLCPADTPEGEQCGLIKNLSLMATVSTGFGDHALEAMRPLLFALGVISQDLLSGDELTPDSPDTLLVFFNGNLLGACRNPSRLIADVKELRRQGLIFQFTSIYHHENTKTINIACDEGRLCRPLIIIENGKSRFDPSEHVPKLTGCKYDGSRSERWAFKDFLNNGVVEFVDVNEENNLLIAMKPEEITKDHTHLEIEPLSLLGIISGLVAYPNHNQSPRNTYTCAMGKQAMGCVGYNQFHRTDNILYLLQYPQKPLCKSKTLDFANYDRFGAGTNASVAVISYSGYDIEDAIVMNKASVDRGFGRCIVMKRHVATCDQVGSHMELIAPVEAVSKDEKKNRRQIQRKKNLDERDGIVYPGSVVQDGDYLLNKLEPDTKAMTPYMAAQGDQAPVMREQPLFHKSPVPAKEIIDRALITFNDQHMRIFKIMYRDTRKPELGDKFASRHGQKGVVGLIVPQEDMPFSETGWCPDLIMNPHGFPSRMTVGKMLECVGSKAAALEGTFCDGSAFGGTPPELIYKTLIKNGFAPNGKEFLTSGITGEPMECYVFAGPIFYQKLKHMVADKVQARARGKLNLLTRQPTEGRAKQGGLRMGEMERDCLIAYGASNLLLERLSYSSDACDVKVCRDCGLFADASFCRFCEKSRLLDCRVPYACKLLFQEMQCMNVVARIKFEERPS